jgi:hypothetical protein
MAGSDIMRTRRRQHGIVWTAAAIAVLAACSRPAPQPEHRTFASAEDAVLGLKNAVAKGSVDDVVAIFGPEGRALIDTSDPATAQRNREVFGIALAETWRLVDDGPRKTLVVGNEDWPFPVPIVREEPSGWRFDTAAGKEEILARRIGRNELAAIRISRAYVMAQRFYAQQGHDGKPAGLYARTLRSDAGQHNGLYWAAGRGQARSPLGDLIAEAAEERRPPGADEQGPAPLYGYYFRILTGQGASAPGGAKNYVVNGEMSGGFALVAWPAVHDATGVMTFVVNQDGVVHEADLGRGTDAAAKSLALYDPDASWATVE